MFVMGTTKNKEGNYEVTVELVEEEYNYLFGVGLNYLVQEGAISLNGEPYEEDYEDEEDEKQSNMDLN